MAAIVLAVVDGRVACPGLAAVGGALEVDAPAVAVALGAGAGENIAVGQDDRLVLDRAEDAVGQSLAVCDHVRPPSSDVMSMPHHSLGDGPTL